MLATHRAAPGKPWEFLAEWARGSPGTAQGQPRARHAWPAPEGSFDPPPRVSCFLLSSLTQRLQSRLVSSDFQVPSCVGPLPSSSSRQPLINSHLAPERASLYAFLLPLLLLVARLTHLQFVLFSCQFRISIGPRSTFHHIVRFCHFPSHNIYLISHACMFSFTAAQPDQMLIAP